jgi:hypothetical protein
VHPISDAVEKFIAESELHVLLWKKAREQDGKCALETVEALMLQRIWALPVPTG